MSYLPPMSVRGTIISLQPLGCGQLLREPVRAIGSASRNYRTHGTVLQLRQNGKESKVGGRYFIPMHLPYLTLKHLPTYLGYRILTQSAAV